MTNKQPVKTRENYVLVGKPQKLVSRTTTSTTDFGVSRIKGKKTKNYIGETGDLYKVAFDEEEKEWEKEIEKWDSLIVSKYRGKSCVMCGLSKKGLLELCKKVEDITKKDMIEKIEKFNEGFLLDQPILNDLLSSLNSKEE